MRSFVTFSWISEVDWASQKATVATSWKGMFNFIEYQLTMFEPHSIWSFGQHLAARVTYPLPWVWASRRSSPCHQGEPPVAESASDHLGLDPWDLSNWNWTPENWEWGLDPWEWEFGMGPLRMRVWDWTPENEDLGLDPWDWKMRIGPLRMSIWEWTPENEHLGLDP